MDSMTRMSPARNHLDQTRTVAIVLMMVLAAFVLMVNVAETAAADPGYEIRITTDRGAQRMAATWNNRVVWEDYRNAQSDIYMYDIFTGTETRLTTNTGYQYNPAIYGDVVVYEDYRNGNYDIYMYNIATRTETRVTTDTSSQYDADVYGDYIVWEDYRNGNADIYMYRISTGTETRVTSSTSSENDPQIWGDKIVWEDTRGSNTDIYYYNISRSTEYRLTGGSYSEYDPDIYGNWIVWRAYDGSYYMVQGYDTYYGTSWRTTDSTSHYWPQIWGSKVVYYDWRNGYLEVWMMDFYTREETSIYADPTGLYDYAIGQYGVTWSNMRYYHYDVWMYVFDADNGYALFTLERLGSIGPADGGVPAEYLMTLTPLWRASISSGLSSGIAAEMTTASVSGDRFLLSCPIFIVAPSPVSISVTALAISSEPVTVAQFLISSRASPLIPIPPAPMK